MQMLEMNNLEIARFYEQWLMTKYPTGHAWRRPRRPGRPMLQCFTSVQRAGR